MSELSFSARASGWESSNAIEIRLGDPSAPGFAAVVKLCGEHDIATSTELRHALSPIFGNVLVDLSECKFIDSTAMSVLIVDLHLRQREGHTLELLAPPENKTIARTLQVSGLNSLFNVWSRYPAHATQIA
jgi:anti-anti-sigma factor